MIFAGFPIETIAESLSGTKERNALWRNENLLAGSRIACAARLSAPQTETAESADLHFVPGAQGASNRIEDRLHNEIGFPAGDPRGIGHLARQAGAGDRFVVHRFHTSPIFADT